MSAVYLFMGLFIYLVLKVVDCWQEVNNYKTPLVHYMVDKCILFFFISVYRSSKWYYLISLQNLYSAFIAMESHGERRFCFSSTFTKRVLRPIDIPVVLHANCNYMNNLEHQQHCFTSRKQNIYYSTSIVSSN